MKKSVLFSILGIPSLLSVVFVLSRGSLEPGQLKATNTKPNIILIMGDDMGFSDLGCFGSEIKTPNLDQLAREGIRFQQFYNMAKCAPTRSTMLTGLYGRHEHSVPFSRLLHDAGYRTIMCGKNHMFPTIPEQMNFGAKWFDRSLTFWTCVKFFFDEEDESPFVINGDPIEIKDMEITRKPFFKTDVFTDYALRWMDEAVADGKPFFLYMPYHAAHFPIQARPEDIAKYRGTYMAGWDVLRQERFEKMKRERVIPEDCRLPPQGDLLHRNKGRYNNLEDDTVWRENFWRYRPWKSLSSDEMVKMDLEMSVYAGMIDRMDQNIGRILDKLKESDQMDNTLIMYLSDNGAEAQDYNQSLDLPPGHPDSYRSMHVTWSGLSNTPFRQYKWFGLGGGCNTHFIAHWGNEIPGGLITNQVGHVVDIAPTILEAAGVNYPTTFEERPVEPLHGLSLLPVLKGGKREEPEWFISGMPNFRMYRERDWKITRINNGEWMLFNLKNDYTEMNDVSADFPQVYDQMISNFEQAKEQVDLFDIWDYRRKN